ncbi:MAG TPA: hypothetical protein VJM34_15080 [Novosphingobium sp.]|nr:hypothetical protein [Novosphingobium sp.]
MPKFVLVATSSALEGREDDYNSWYDKVHLKDLLDLPGVKSARRFDATPFGFNAAPADYLAIYEIEADDAGAVMAALGKGVSSGEMQMTDAIDRTSSNLTVWQERPVSE